MNFQIICRWLIAFNTVIYSCLSSGGQSAVSLSKWSDVAREDVAAIRSALIDAHPGALEDRNSEFNSWLTLGFLRANELAQKASSRPDALAIARYYAVGFKDGHLGVVYQAATASKWAGWMVTKQGEDFIVGHVADDWPVQVPPIGSKLLSCDGKEISALVSTEIAPYVDQRLSLDASWLFLTKLITLDHSSIPLLGRKLVKQCRVEHARGAQKTYVINWQPVDGGRLLANPRQSSSFNITPFSNNGYWIQIPTFNLSNDEIPIFDSFINGFRRISESKLIVLDVRGNTGGNSIYGTRILNELFESGLQGDAVGIEPYALWRTSPLALSTITKAAERLSRAHGEDSSEFKFVKQIERLLKQSLAKGDKWVQQPELPSELFVSDADEGGTFSGKIILLTDSYCASSCLNFADSLLSRSNVIHMGHPTSGDTVYIDTGAVSLPSGATLILPLKVWRHRVRGDNQSYSPAHLFNGDIADTEQVKAWLLQKFESGDTP